VKEGRANKRVGPKATLYCKVNGTQESPAPTPMGRPELS
jgi:hypothetical protein